MTYINININKNNKTGHPKAACIKEAPMHSLDTIELYLLRD
uniref:Uncharacterized protein n=1 Tax=Colwellia sp. C1 TaxID=1737566 RepID=A0A0P0KTE8_9GAMM|nr:hypothetical protein [Colwellia sp. C1]